MINFIVNLIKDDDLLFSQYKEDIKNNADLHIKMEDLKYDLEHNTSNDSNKIDKMNEDIKYNMEIQYGEFLERVLHRYLFPILAKIPPSEWEREDERLPSPLFLTKLSPNNKKYIMDNYTKLFTDKYGYKRYMIKYKID